jgi:hypothetical protein
MDREQLDTSIGKDRGTGIARELQRAATRSQDSRLKNLLVAFRDISGLCDQFSLPKTINAKQLYKRVDEESYSAAGRSMPSSQRPSLSHAVTPMCPARFAKLATSHTYRCMCLFDAT